MLLTGFPRFYVGLGGHRALREHMHLGVFMRVYHIRCMVFMGASCLRARIDVKQKE